MGMEGRPRRSALWKALGLVLLVSAAVAGGLWFWIQSVADRKWAKIEREVRGLMAEAEKRGGPRPTFHADSEPGNAWEEYDRALAILKPFGLNNFPKEI